MRISPALIVTNCQVASLALGPRFGCSILLLAVLRSNRVIIGGQFCDAVARGFFLDVHPHSFSFVWLGLGGGCEACLVGVGQCCWVGWTFLSCLL